MSLTHRVRLFVDRVNRLLSLEVYRRAQRRPLRGDVVLYESFAGNGTVCNPRAIFDALYADPEFAGLRHVWVVRARRMRSTASVELGSRKRVAVVRRRSLRYFIYLARAKYLINNATFPKEFIKRDGQVYLNTWHGTPLKRMGFDRSSAGDRAHQSRLAANTLGNFLASDFLVSSGEFMTQQMYVSGYALKGIWNGAVLEVGQPRTDVQFQPRARELARLELHRQGMQLRGRKVALYAPTWRGRSFKTPDDPSQDAARVIHRLQGALGDEWIVLVKFHQAVVTTPRQYRQLRRRIVSQEMPTNVVLAGTDLLISDFSSVILDYLPANRPVIFYAPDAADYTADRGLYVDLDDLPGPVTTNEEELATAALAVALGETDHFTGAREVWRQRFSPLDDGNATSRVVRAVFRGDATHVVRLEAAHPSILLYLGDMRLNGITSSALSLLNSLRRVDLDVSVLFGNPTVDSAWQCVERIPDHVRIFRRVGSFSMPRWHRRRFQRFLETGIDSSVREVTDMPYSEAFAGEWRRTFGQAKFDFVIDFSGYGPFWSFLMLQSPAARRSIWLHNDMLADAQRTVNGEQHLLTKLGAAFTTYRFFDSAVSVSAALAVVNARNLCWAAPRETFSYARNSIDAARITYLSTATPDSTAYRWLIDQEGSKVFVTIGRLSTEKNHRRLIDAFEKVHLSDPHVRLLIIGTGPLKAELESVIEQRGLSEVVCLAGEQANPYAYLARADCFVLSSDHEGQPMVILEALTLGLPVVTTDFSSAQGALPSGCGVIVGRSVAGLAGGMQQFLDGAVARGNFDPTEYEAAAVHEFLVAIGAHGIEKDAELVV